MVNVKNAAKLFLKKDWKFIPLLKTALNANKKIFALSLIALIVFIDQFSKFLALNNKLPAWKILSELTCNYNLSLSLNLNLFLFGVGWFIAFVTLLFLIYRFKSVFLLIVLAGALSNLIDRFLVGCVIDYISFFNFPIFNLADFFISFGFLGFLIFYKK